MATVLFSVRSGLNICIKFRLKSVNKGQTLCIIIGHSTDRKDAFHLWQNGKSLSKNLERFGQQIRNNRKVLKCGAGEGWRRSVGPIMW